MMVITSAKAGIEALCRCHPTARRMLDCRRLGGNDLAHRLIVVVGIVSLTGLSLGACGDGGGGAGGAAGNDGGGGGQPPGWEQTPCYQCAAPACEVEQAACNGDPGCAAALACAKACPAAPDGSADPSCLDACPSPMSAAGSEALLSFMDCVATSAAGCPSCGGGQGGGGSCAFDEPVLCEQCDPSTLSDACERCDAENCCTATANIFPPGPGGALGTCWANCPDYACEQACYDMYPEQLVYLGSWIACFEVHCRAPALCSPLADCGTCRATECADELAACYTNPACYQAIACVGNCPGMTCSSACLAEFSDGTVAFEALGACLAMRCLEVCGG